MQHLSFQNNQSSPNLDNQTRNSNEVTRIGQNQLNSLIASYYAHMSANNLSDFSTKFNKEFETIQQQIIGVVQMRKDMEKLVELDVVHSQHFFSMEKLIQQNLQNQRTIESLSLKIKQYQSTNIAAMLKILEERLKSVEYSPNVCLDSQIRMLANQISRSFLNHGRNQAERNEDSDFQMQNYQLELKSKSQEALSEIIKEQNEKYELLKNIYGCKFREISIRDELISERQTAFFQYSTSNHELIDELLREKERQKNLSKTQRQKFEELLKARHEIELQNEHLNYHQNNLASYYEIQLSKLKQLRSQQQNLWKAQKEQLTLNENRKNTEIQKLQQMIKLLTKQKDEVILGSVNFKSKQIDLQAQNKKLQQFLDKMNKEKNQYQEKMDSLQSQLNQNILKLSQANRTKAEIAQRLQEANKKITEYQNLSSALKARISSLQGQRDKMMLKNSQISSQNERLKQKYESSQKQIAVFQLKIQYLQDQLTQNFIISNSQIKKHQEQIQQKTKQIQRLQQENKHLFSQKQESIVVNSITPHKLNAADEDQLRIQLKYQLQRQSTIKQKLLDQAIEKISNLLY